jgi:hypothetical protein
MKIIEFALAIVAAVGLALWRGRALFRFGLRKRDL